MRRFCLTNSPIWFVCLALSVLHQGGLIGVTATSPLATPTPNTPTVKRPELRIEYDELMTAQKGLEAEKGAIAKEKTGLDNEEARLNATNDLIKAAVATYNKDMDVHNIFANRQRAAAAIHNANRCIAPPENPGLCWRYNQEAKELDAEAKRVNDRLATFDVRAAAIRQRRAALTEATLDLARRRKELNWKSSDVGRREADHLDQLKRLRRDPRFIDDVKVRQIMSRDCAEIESLEWAHQCLQAIWDGALKPNKLSTKKLKPKPLTVKPNN